MGKFVISSDGTNYIPNDTDEGTCDYMRDAHKELVMKTAIQEYKNSVLFGFSRSTAHAINMMENAYIMCSGNIEGIEELRRTIQEAKEKYKKELGN